MPETIATAATYFTAGAAGGLGATAINAVYWGTYVASTVAISYGASSLMAPDKPRYNESLAGRLDMALDSHPPRRLVYGECRVSGPLSYIDADQRSASGKKDEMLHYECVLASHEIDSVITLFLNDQAATLETTSNEAWPDGDTSPTDANGVSRYRPSGTDYAEDMMIKIHHGDQTAADADAVITTNINDTDGRKSTDIGKGIAYIYATARTNLEVFSQGFPNVSALVRGKNDVYDPRDTTYKYTDNPALCLADWMITPKESGGGGWDYDDIDESALIAAANICDETTDTYAGGSASKRYVIGGTILASNPRVETISLFLDAMAGALEKVNGKWVIKAGGYSAPNITLSESDLLEPINISPNQSQRDLFNAIRPILAGTYSEWQESQVDIVRGEIKQDITTVDHANNTLSQETTLLKNGDMVRFDVWMGTGVGFNANNLPSGINENTYYYVINSNSSTYQISAIPGGTAVNFGALSTGTLVSFYDRYLTEDNGKRKIKDSQYSLVTDPIRARRLAFIELKRSRGQIIIEGAYSLKAFDLTVGDIVRVIDSERGFYAEVDSDINATISTDGTVTATSHGLSNGDPVLLKTTGTSGLTEDIIYYVRDADTNTFHLSRHSVGHRVKADTSSSITIRPIQGKLFEVRKWSFGPVGEVLGVRLTLKEVNDDDWDWDSGFLTAPENDESVTLSSVRNVTAPSSLAVDSGTTQLYIQSDGTVISRAYLTWTPSGQAFVDIAGQYEIQWKLSSESDWKTAAYLDGGVSSYYFVNPQDGIDYDFRVRAINSVGYKSTWDTVSDHTIIGKTADPNPPTSFLVDWNAADFNVSITWTDPEDFDLKQLDLWRRIGPSGGFTKIAAIPPGLQKYTDRAIPSDSDQTYYYEIKAIDTGNRDSTAVSDNTTVLAQSAPALSSVTYPAAYESYIGTISVVFTATPTSGRYLSGWHASIHELDGTGNETGTRITLDAGWWDENTTTSQTITAKGNAPQGIIGRARLKLWVWDDRGPTNERGVTLVESDFRIVKLLIEPDVSTVYYNPNTATYSPASASITSTATGWATSPTAYQWEYSDNGGSTWSNLAGETSSSLSVPGANVTANPNRIYRLDADGVKSGTQVILNAIRNGQTGASGPQGPQGATGSDGISTYKLFKGTATATAPGYHTSYSESQQIANNGYSSSPTSSTYNWQLDGTYDPATDTWSWDPPYRYFNKMYVEDLDSGNLSAGKQFRAGAATGKTSGSGFYLDADGYVRIGEEPGVAAKYIVFNPSSGAFDFKNVDINIYSTDTTTNWENDIDHHGLVISEDGSGIPTTESSIRSDIIKTSNITASKSTEMVPGEIKIDGKKVLGSQQTGISDVPTAGSSTAASNAAAINSILAALRSHGLIAT